MFLRKVHLDSNNWDLWPSNYSINRKTVDFSQHIEKDLTKQEPKHNGKENTLPE